MYLSCKYINIVNRKHSNSDTSSDHKSIWSDMEIEPETSSAAVTYATTGATKTVIYLIMKDIL